MRPASTLHTPETPRHSSTSASREFAIPREKVRAASHEPTAIGIAGAFVRVGHPGSRLGTRIRTRG